MLQVTPNVMIIIMIIRFQDPLQVLWFIRHSRSSKITDFWDLKQVLFVTKSNTHTLLTFLVSKSVQTTVVVQLVFVLRVKLCKAVMKSNFFKVLDAFSQNVPFSSCNIFFSPSTYLVSSILSVVVEMHKTHVFCEVFSNSCCCYDKWNSVFFSFP